MSETVRIPTALGNIDLVVHHLNSVGIFHAGSRYLDGALCSETPLVYRGREYRLRLFLKRSHDGVGWEQDHESIPSVSFWDGSKDRRPAASVTTTIGQLVSRSATDYLQAHPELPSKAQNDSDVQRLESLQKKHENVADELRKIDAEISEIYERLAE